VQNALDEKGTPNEKDEHMVSGAKRLISQLSWHATAMSKHRAAVGVPQ